MPAEPSVLFVCVHNAGRSRMAAGFLSSLAPGVIDVRSAGSAPAEQVDPAAAAAMAEAGIDITAAAPRALTTEDAEAADVVITMGCGDACPAVPGARRLDWPLDDPAGRTLPEVRAIRDDIRARVEELIPRLVQGSPAATDGAAANPVRERVRHRVQRARNELTALSHAIHARPETAFNEHDAARRITAVLSGHGFTVEHGAGGLDTAFTAVYGSGELTIGLCAEYDALPEMGHACGHNIIAASATGAALGLAVAAEELGIRVMVIGTPAEESGGGKIRLLERGVFDGVSAAMMIHPEGEDIHPADVRTPAVARLTATFTGRPAHAAATPHLGVNAADAAVVAQVAVGLLRQQLTDDCRIGLYIRDGGRATNIIPELSVLECEVRAHATDTLADLRRRVVACFEAGAHATGADLDIAESGPPYAALEQDPVLVDFVTRNLTALGREPAQRGVRTVGSTDMGDVTRALPGIHPMIGIHGARHRPHTAGFADEAHSPAADDALIDGALALALTSVDTALDPPTRDRLIHTQRERRTHRESAGPRPQA